MNYEKLKVKMYNYIYISISKKKVQTRAEFKLCYIRRLQIVSRRFYRYLKNN